MTTDRREFLKKMAAGAAFVAPVVKTVAVPARLAAQSGKGGGGDMDKTTMGSGMLVMPGPSGGTTRAPWDVDPPGGE